MRAAVRTLAVALALLSSVVPGADAASRIKIGGDLVGAASSKPLIQTSHLSTPRMGRAPAGAGAVMVSVRVSGARAAGRVLVGPARARANAAVPFARGATTTGTVLVKVGAGQKVVAWATGGAPRVSVRVTGWVPRTSNVAVPPLGRSAKSASGRVTVIGAKGAPPASDTVVLAVRATKAGTVTTGGGTAVATLRRNGTALIVAAPGSDGTARLGGTAKLTAAVVGWSAAGGELTAAGRPAKLATVRGTKKLVLRGRAGVPFSGVRSVVVAVHGKAGNLLQVVDLDERGAGRVASPGGKATATVVGYVADPGGSRTSYVPRAGTVVLGTGDVVSAGKGTLTLDATAPVPKVGGYVFARVPGEAASAVGHVDAVRRVKGGRRVVSVTPAALDAAFSDYDAHYDGPLTLASGTGDPRSVRRSGFGAKLRFGGGELFECSLGADVPRITSWSLDLEDGTTNLDLDLGAPLIDFSTKGRLVARLGVSGGSRTLECSLAPELKRKLSLLTVPIGSTGFALKLGPALKLSLTSPFAPSSLTATARYVAGFSYIGGKIDGLAAAGAGAAVETPPMTMDLSAGLTATVGPAVVFEGPVTFDPNASVSAGAKIGVGPPDANEEGVLKGPKCIDVTGNGYVEIGARLTLKFWERIKIDGSFAKNFESPGFDLFRGPCWGYIGSITYTRYEVQPVQEYFDTFSTDEGVTLSPKPGFPARFEGNQGNGLAGTVSQPFTWTAYNRSYRRASGGEPSNGCVSERNDGAGSGERPTAFAPAFLFTIRDDISTTDGLFDRDAGTVFLPGTHTGNGSQCLDANSGSSSPASGMAMSGGIGGVYVPTPADPMTLDVLQGTATRDIATVTFDLRRVEVPRAP